MVQNEQWTDRGDPQSGDPRQSQAQGRHQRPLVIAIHPLFLRNPNKLFRGSSSEEGEEEVVPVRRKSALKKPTQSTVEGFSDGFDEDLFGDEEDRRKLLAMTEIEREAVLYERSQAVY